MRVDGFWLGARSVAYKLDLAEWVRNHGGWEHIRSVGPKGWRAAGLAAPLVALWERGEARATEGKAYTLLDEDYPERLRELPDAPPVVFVEGDVAALRLQSVAVVGTRRTNTYGRRVARELGHHVAAAGCAVVSGLARGIDAEAHWGALGSGITVAVLAHGLAHTAPASNARLRRAILESGGALITAHPDEDPPRPWTFPVRNRWIAGLSQRVVVVQAPLKSGALHTVRAAADYGREVYAVPGPIHCPVSTGTNFLLQRGVTPLTRVDEFVESMTGSVALTGWVDQLIAGCSLVDLARERGLSVEEVVAEVEMMEAVGDLVRLPGQRYGRG